MIKYTKALWKIFRQPSERNPDPHHRGATGVWHAALGAIPGLVLSDYGEWPAAATVAFVTVFYLIKECGDLKRNGAVADSIEDAVFVASGAFFAYDYALVGLVFVNIMALGVMLAQVKEDGDVE